MMLEKLKCWFNPYSAQALRIRARKLPKSPYRYCLELAAEQIERGKITEQAAKKAIEYLRTGQKELTTVAIVLLDPNEKQQARLMKKLKALKK